MQKLFLYARKSTDVEDKQILSIEAQLAELRAVTKKEGLFVVEELIEKQSAKIPGRPLFNAMLDRIEKGEADGIICWHPDRLARNSVDGGKIIYLLDTGKLTILKFNTFWFENTPQGKFMLNIAFGQSKYYVDSLSENTKRGLRQKVRRGEYPSLAPIGYLNDVRTKTIVIEKRKSKVIVAAYELYAQGNSRLEDVSKFLANGGIVTSGGKPLKRDQISYILSNPFYYGYFRYAGELHEGKHKSIISKKLFDQIQEVLKRRARPHHKTKNEPKPLCGLFQCGECSMMITAEVQKGHTYYRCTRKSKVANCIQPFVRGEALDQQLSLLIEKFSLPKQWGQKMLRMIDTDEKNDIQFSANLVQETEKKIFLLSTKLERLLSGYLEQDIEREVYLQKKAELMSEKKTFEEQIFTLRKTQTGWLEPMRQWINEAQSGPKIARALNQFDKKSLAKKMFGSNLRLTNRKIAVKPSDCGEETPWSALRAARENIEKIPNCRIIVPRERIELS